MALYTTSCHWAATQVHGSMDSLTNPRQLAFWPQPQQLLAQQLQMQGQHPCKAHQGRGRPTGAASNRYGSALHQPDGRPAECVGKGMKTTMTADSMASMSRTAAIAGRGTGFAVHDVAWTRELTEDGRVYYKRATGSTQWHLPNDMYHSSTASKSETSQQDQPVSAVVGMHVESHGGENGFNQAIELASEPQKNLECIKEKKLISTFLDEVSQDTGKFCFGIKDTMQAALTSSRAKESCSSAAHLSPVDDGPTRSSSCMTVPPVPSSLASLVGVATVSRGLASTTEAAQRLPPRPIAAVVRAPGSDASQASTQIRPKFASSLEEKTLAGSSTSSTGPLSPAPQTDGMEGSPPATDGMMKVIESAIRGAFGEDSAPNSAAMEAPVAKGSLSYVAPLALSVGSTGTTGELYSDRDAPLSVHNGSEGSLTGVAMQLSYASSEGHSALVPPTVSALSEGLMESLQGLAQASGKRRPSPAPLTFDEECDQQKKIAEVGSADPPPSETTTCESSCAEPGDSSAAEPEDCSPVCHQEFERMLDDWYQTGEAPDKAKFAEKCRALGCEADGEAIWLSLAQDIGDLSKARSCSAEASVAAVQEQGAEAFIGDQEEEQSPQAAGQYGSLRDCLLQLVADECFMQEASRKRVLLSGTTAVDEDSLALVLRGAVKQEKKRRRLT